jgi:energy-coupling factor transporter transmembrane protein EcfT
MSNITPKEGEEVLMHLRKSIFVLWKQKLVFTFAVIIAVILLTFFYQYPIANIIAVVLLIAGLGYTFYYFLIWYYYVHIITNIRVITHAKKRLFGHEFAEFSYDEVSDITYTVKGMLATLFQYGTVNIIFDNLQMRELTYLSTPGVVQETLKNLVDVTKRKK